jgi:nitroimidazol reductase NimA-like FMN-containing flavoprotein (pyridoxamine 5'-phosphate oxidase superfamily)
MADSRRRKKSRFNVLWRKVVGKGAYALLADQKEDAALVQAVVKKRQ